MYYTATRLRPLARRRARTLRPDVVFMRTRNPWDFARLRFFGLYVNDIVHILLHILRRTSTIHNLST